MDLGFWEKLKKPIFVLAPLADVTDSAFRRLVVKYGKPDVLWTEFVSADGLDSAGKENLIRDLEYTEAERPIVAQFFSPDPAKMKRASELAVELGFDGVDLNMGCPDKNVVKQGSGSAMIRTPDKAKEVIRAAKAGAGKLPVSVKTRIGYSKDSEMEAWVRAILEEEPAVLTLHARTKKDMSKVPARWENIKRAVEIRDEMKIQTLIFGNGDVFSLLEAKKKVQETGCDGVMVGRGIFGNPWFFADKKVTPTTEEKLKVLVEHTKLYEELIGTERSDFTFGTKKRTTKQPVHGKNFALMKKHFKAYVRDWPGASELRAKLMETNNAKEVEVVVEEYLKLNQP